MEALSFYFCFYFKTSDKVVFLPVMFHIREKSVCLDPVNKVEHRGRNHTESLLRRRELFNFHRHRSVYWFLLLLFIFMYSVKLFNKMYWLQRLFALSS